MRWLALALVLLAPPAQANTLLDVRDWAHCRLYPSHARCRPPEPVQAPVVAPPPVLAPAPPAPQASPEPLQAPLPTVAPVQVPAAPAPPMAAPAPPRAAPVVIKPAKAKPKARPKSKFVPRRVPKIPKTRAIPTAGPDLPWPCWMVRLNAGRKTCGELAAEGKRRNISLTPKQHYQAAVCIGRCFPR